VFAVAPRQQYRDEQRHRLNTRSAIPSIEAVRAFGKMVLLGSVALHGCGHWVADLPRPTGAWTEEDLCDESSRRTLVVGDADGNPMAGAEVWTEARLREGGEGMGEVVGTDVIVRGVRRTTDVHGRVEVCDVTDPLLREYGTAGVAFGTWMGRTWRSVLAVEIFIRRDGEYVTVRRFASRSWGTGTVYDAPWTVLFVSPRTLAPGQQPVVARPSNELPFEPWHPPT
jgi:hypothetical protein